LDSPETGIDICKAAEIVGEDTIVMGNINPVSVMTNATTAEVKRVARELLEKMRPYPNFILSAGCDLPPNRKSKRS